MVIFWVKPEVVHINSKNTSYMIINDLIISEYQNKKENIWNYPPIQRVEAKINKIV